MSRQRLTKLKVDLVLAHESKMIKAPPFEQEGMLTIHAEPAYMDKIRDNSIKEHLLRAYPDIIEKIDPFFAGLHIFLKEGDRV